MKNAVKRIFLAKFRFDTAENEPAKNFAKFAKKIANFVHQARGVSVGAVTWREVIVKLLSDGATARTCARAAPASV